MIKDYILKYHLQDCINILSDKDNLGYFSIKLDFLKLFEAYPDVGDKVLSSPIHVLPACNQDIIKAQHNVLELEEYKEHLLKLDYYYLKRNVHARFFGLPVCPELHRTMFPKNVDLGCFLKVTGTVVRITQSKMLEYQRKYVCQKCKYENCVEAEFENRYILKAPSKCKNADGCKFSTFTQVNLVSREHCKDYQEIKIQELVNKLSVGSIPGSMWVVLEDDLVDSCKPGDDVNICGTVRRRWRPCALSKKSEVELVLLANYLEVCNAQRSEAIASAPDIKQCFDEYWSKYQQCPLKGRDNILRGVCPQVYGLHLVKLAVLLTVITGADHTPESEEATNQEDIHSTRVRGQCHLLLVGDPGTGKSQLLGAGAELSARSVLAAGAGSSRAGLTCTALREEGSWQLEAGALVLADGGVCCIDEVGQLRDHDRAAIHEAMEQQTVSIAKAGIVCKLNTRCAVIAACNPKGRYETDSPLAANVALGTPLLSRFDLIFVLLDSKNREWDELVSSYILFGDSQRTQNKQQWTTDKLQMYCGAVGGRGTRTGVAAGAVLRAYYMRQRRAPARDPARTTVRMLDSLLRLSQAHCRLMYRTTILPVDAIVAISLMDLSMQDCTLTTHTDALHSTFHKHPDLQYLRLAKELLNTLDLKEIWKEELLYYGKMLQVDHKTLEVAVERNDTTLFAKYDNLVDDDIPLSASLITSSYFNNKKAPKENDCELISDNNKENFRNDNCEQKPQVSEKLAATLKKHATSNKDNQVPLIIQKKYKRKKKETMIETSEKKLKKTAKKTTNNSDNSMSSDDEESVTRNMLNAMPSVNDFFTELGIDLKFDSDQEDAEKVIENDAFFTRHSTQKENINAKDEVKKRKDTQDSNKDNIKEEPNQSSEVIEKHLNKSTDSVGSKTMNKLKQFQFVQSHDLSKYEEKVNKSMLQKSPVKLVDVKDDSNNSSTKKSVPSSQISIFESSDCDIDLDI